MAKDEDRIRDSEDVAGIPTPSVDGDDTSARVPAVRDTAPSNDDDAPATPSSYGPDAYEQVRHTRSASLWSGLVAGAVVLLVLLAFIVQNQQNTQIKLLFWEANLPLGVSLLVAAILGALTVGLAGGLRIFQLRRAAKKMRD